MLTAVIARPPVYGGKVVSFDATAAMRIKGVKKIVKIPEAAVPAGYNPVGGIAVLATNTWAAMEGRKALKIKWDHGTNASYDSDVYRAELAANVKKPGKPGRQQGDVTAALASAAKKIAADYYVPHLSHAQMEPVAAVASFRNGAVEAWAPSQSPQTARDTIAAYLKLPAEQVTVHVTLLGGGFGRKSKPDFIVEAAYLSREAGVPVRVQWTREDDLKNSYYHTVAAHHLEAGLDGDGAVKAWLHRCAYPPIGSTFAPDVAGPSPGELTNGASDLPYAIPNLSIEVCPAPAHTRIGWYRSVNANHHGFAIGSFLDELAHASGKDPKSFLLDLLGPDRQMDLTKEGAVGRVSNYGARWTDHPIDTGRIRRVLELVAEKSDWGSPLPKGRGRGIAVHGSFLSYVAVVVEAEVAADGSVRVPRATMAVDAGFIANPDRARSQMEGALIMGMSNAVYSEISFKDGHVAQSNYSDYRVTRMNAAPRAISVHLVESEGLPGGIGEPGVPPVAPALANAIYSATGTRIRRLPVGNQLAASRRTASAGG
jgi:isoquinoline 1-oxidoreductase beta subunit